MRIRTTDRDLATLRADVAVCFAYEGDKAPRGIAHDDLRRDLAGEMRAEGFRGRRGDAVQWNADGRFGSRRFLVIGLGRPSDAPGEAIRGGSVRAARLASKIRAARLAIRLPEPDGADPALEVRAAVEGAMLGAYRFERYLTDPERKTSGVEALEVSCSGPRAACRKAAGLGEVVGRAVSLARDLVNEPPSAMNPAAMARAATAAARESGLASKVLRRRDLERFGMGALLAVARGSAVAPHVVHLTYRPKRKRRGAPKIVLAGKGVTFDSGGLDLKPSSGMLTMKCDMGGAAAVIASMTALAAIGCRAEVHGVVGLVENMTGSSAYKPGDILRTYLGKSVEVTNTDAEGRLVLCDLLAWAAETIRPDRMVDLATLTGACMVALGTDAAGLFTRHDALRDDILLAGRLGGEKLWPLPMYDEYLEAMQKGPADLTNTGERWGGAITAALFLGEFVPRTVPWAHLDIAGPAFAEKPSADGPVGGTGAGVRTLVRWLETL